MPSIKRESAMMRSVSAKPAGSRKAAQGVPESAFNPISGTIGALPFSAIGEAVGTTPIAVARGGGGTTPISAVGGVGNLPIDSTIGGMLDPGRVFTPAKDRRFGGIVGFFDSNLWLDWQLGSRAKPRSEITVPISPTEAINENTVFEDPIVAGKLYALPIYKVVEAQQKVRVLLEPAGEGWLLTVRFSPAQRRTDAEVIPHTIKAFLNFIPPTTGAAKNQAFVVEQEDNAIYKATLALGQITEMSQVYDAMTKAEEYKTQLVIRCNFQAATPVEMTSPDAEQLYSTRGRAVDVIVGFSFNPALFPYVYQGITNVSGKPLGFKLHQKVFQGRTHHYYQDEASPDQFYYLPDSYKITRRPDLPYSPFLRVKFSSADGSREQIRASLEYTAAPVVDAERLADAREQLKGELPKGITEAIFQPLVVSDHSQLSLSLALPQAGAPGSPRQARPGVVKNLTEPIEDQITDLTIDQFSEIYDAMFGTSAVVFKGDVLVEGGEMRADESVPFVARLNDLHGKLFEEFETPSGNGVQVVLRNAIESPLTIPALPVQIAVEGQMMAASIANLTKGGAVVSFPVTLQPGEEVTVQVVADQAIPANSIPNALFNVDQVVVNPDVEAVYNAILVTTVNQEYWRSIKVLAFPSWFAAEKNLDAIVIDFTNGDAVTLDAQHLEMTARVSAPISDLVTKKVQESTYTYTQINVRSDGQERFEKSDKGDTLVPTLTA